MNHPAAVAAYDSCYTGVTLNHKSIYQSTVFQPNLLGQAMPALFESPSKQNNSELYINWNCGMLNPHKCPPPIMLGRLHCESLQKMKCLMISISQKSF